MTAKPVRVAMIAAEHFDADYVTAMNTAAEAAGLPANRFTLNDLLFVFGFLGADAPLQAKIKAALDHEQRRDNALITLDTIVAEVTNDEIATEQKEYDAFIQGLAIIRAGIAEPFATSTESDEGS
ncbi:MAG: hypothetical protein AAGK74_00745 [Chloroflexota bacterium]